MYADALWDHVGIKPDELSFKVGNMVAILDMTDELMWQGSMGEKTGWFQASFVRVRGREMKYARPVLLQVMCCVEMKYARSVLLQVMCCVEMKYARPVLLQVMCCVEM